METVELNPVMFCNIMNGNMFNIKHSIHKVCMSKQGRNISFLSSNLR